MIFVDLRIFATRMAHVYVAGSTFHLKRRALLQTFSFSIERSYGEDGYRQERNDCTILPKTHQKKTFKSFRQRNSRAYILSGLQELRGV